MKHIIFHGQDQHGNQVRHRVEGGFIGPLIAAAAGFLLPKILGMGVSEVDNEGTERIIVEQIPKTTKTELSDVMRKAFNTGVTEHSGAGIFGRQRGHGKKKSAGAIGMGSDGSGAIGMGRKKSAGAIGMGSNLLGVNGSGAIGLGGAIGMGKHHHHKKKKSSGESPLSPPMATKTVFRL